ncbi:hypothetical protein [Endozoicomonas arenosclerae]|uniref:hypothetical protein n=1 Tax=Endozoicomonas arenosclerae TaxID=1633495 RepID=UPI000AFD1722|nr:hypothetical protein [Endozoicomonas arenosclerae]
MSQVLVFNHHSLPFDSQSSARAAIPEFIQVALRCRGYGYNLMLLDESMDPNWFQVQLAPDYAWRNWYEEARNDSSLKEVVRAFRSLQTRQPLLTEADLSEIGYSREVGLEGELKGGSALLACFFYNSFLVSLPSSDEWRKNKISVWVLDLDDNGEDFSESIAELDNIFSTASLDYHKETLDSCRAAQLTTGKELWSKRKEYFSELVFLDELGSQLKNWRHRADILQKARDLLICFNDFACLWKSGEFTDYQHEHLISCGLSVEVSGESSSVNDDPSKRKEREFWLPTGEKVNCQNHAKLADGYRLHFYPDSKEKIIYVAYLGPHLKT